MAGGYTALLFRLPTTMFFVTPSRFVHTLLLTVALILIAGPAFAQDPAVEIRQMLSDRDAEIKKLLGPSGTEVSADTRETLRDVVNSLIDFEAMGRQALGPFWEDLTADQRTRFVDVFADIVKGQSLADLDPYRASVSYESVAVDGIEAKVVTRTVFDDVPMAVVYNLTLRDTSWMATDIILDEVSTVGGYSRSFQSMIRRRGFDTLVERLEKRRDAMNTD
jgi:phospholipid transport system substrate-binding protein